MQSATKEPTLQDCLLNLLRGIQSHAVIAGEADGAAFRAELAALESRFAGPENAHRLVDSAVQILGKYGTQTSHALAQQQSGLATAVERWTGVEEQIKAISTADDLDAVKTRLASEVSALRRDALQIIGTMEGPRTTARVFELDQLTGLPARGHAEAELARIHAQPEDGYAALFVVKRLALINAKFGYSRGDQVLLKVVVHLAQSLPGFHNLFRWAPCAFLTLAPPETSYKELRGRVQMIELGRLTPTLEWEGRSAMVPVVIDCRIISLKDFATTSDLFLRLDTLAADA